LKTLAVTGGLATGKTTVCRFFEELGAEVVSADEIVHEFLQESSPIYEQVCRVLGEEGFSSRQEIADRVFRDPGRLAELERLLHPEVRREIEARAKVSEALLFVAEVPLLYEAGLERDFDAVAAVVCSEELARERYSGSHFDERASRMLPIEEKGRRADFVIENGGSLGDLQDRVSEIFQEMSE
jgi:dephospho-CoA kinase